MMGAVVSALGIGLYTMFMWLLGFFTLIAILVVPVLLAVGVGGLVYEYRRAKSGEQIGLFWPPLFVVSTFWQAWLYIAWLLVNYG